MEKLQKYLEYQTEIALIILGLALVVFGFYFYFDIKHLEETKKVIQMNRFLRIVYNLGGKYSILAFFEIFGMVVLFYSIKQLKDLKH